MLWALAWRSVQLLEWADLRIQVGGQHRQDLAQVVQVVVRPLGDIGVNADLAEARVMHHVRPLLGAQLSHQPILILTTIRTGGAAHDCFVLWGPAAPLGPVVAPLVPRSALLPAPTPRLRRAVRMGATNLPS